MRKKTDWQLRANVEEETSWARVAHARRARSKDEALDAVVQAAFDRGVAYAYDSHADVASARRHLTDLRALQQLARDVAGVDVRATNPSPVEPSRALEQAAETVGKQSVATALTAKAAWGMDAAFYAGVAYGYATARGKTAEQKKAMQHYDTALTHLRSAMTTNVRQASLKAKLLA